MNAQDLDVIRQWLHELNEETDGPMYARVLAVVNEQVEVIEQLRARVVELEGVERALARALARDGRDREVKRLTAQSDAVLALHERRGDHCHRCSKDLAQVVAWPCPTAAALGVES